MSVVICNQTISTVVLTGEDSKIQRDATPVQSGSLSELLAGCAHGNEEALAILYRLSAAQVFAVLLRLLKVHSFAEEALQNTYSRIWRSARDYRSELGEPMIWILSLARTEALAVARERQVWQDLPVESTVDQGEAAGAVPVFAQIDEPTQQCLVSLYCHGSTLQSLAEQSSESVDAVKQRVRDALRLISESDHE